MASSSKIRWYSTIRTKIISVVIITATLVLGGAGYFSYKYIESTATAELTKLADVSADRLSQHLVIPMWNLDNEQVAELLSAEMKEQRIAGIVVRDEDKSTLFAAKERDARGQVVDSLGTTSGDFISVDRQVMNGDDVIGVVSIFLTREYLRRDLAEFGRGVLVTVLALDVIIFVIMTLVLGRLLINPVMKLAAGAERISRGDLNQAFAVNSRDEIGYLATTFNRMQYSLNLAIRKLKEQHV